MVAADRVQFRAHEDMQLLSGTRQSGGERSVSTILYLIALQVQYVCMEGRGGGWAE